jgi:Flp pilus assembly protein TadD
MADHRAGTKGVYCFCIAEKVGAEEIVAPRVSHHGAKVGSELVAFRISRPSTSGARTAGSSSSQQQILRSGIQALALNNFAVAEPAFSQLVKLDPSAAKL